MRRKGMLLLLSVLLIMSMTTVALSNWTPFNIVEYVSSVEPVSGGIRHSGYHLTDRYVEQIGIRWWYMLDLQVKYDQCEWAEGERYWHGGFISAISSTTDTEPGTHQTVCQHWAQDYDFGGVPVTKWESSGDSHTVHGRNLVNLHDLRQSMIADALKTFALDGWKEYDIYYDWDTTGPFDWGIGATLLKVLEPGDYWPVVFTKGNDVAVYVVKGDGSELLVTVEDVERFMTADDVLFTSVSQK